VNVAGRVINIRPAAIVWRTAILGGCTLIQVRDSRQVWSAVSRPICGEGHQTDERSLLARPFSYRATWYVNYFRFWLGSRHQFKACMAIVNPDERGPIRVVGTDADGLEANTQYLTAMYREEGRKLGVF
jgi:hypothetical protein